MKNSDIKRILLFFSMIGCFAYNAAAQIDNSKVYFYEYSTGSENLEVVKFNYSKSQMQIKSIKRAIVKRNLASDINYYENQVWGDDFKHEADENYKERYEYDTLHRKYTYKHMNSVYVDNCEKCAKQCKTLREYDKKATDCWGYGCGRHGNVVGAITWVYFEKDMSYLYEQCESIKNNEWYGVGKHKQLTKENLVLGYSKYIQSNTYIQNASNTIYLFQNYIVKFDHSRQKLYLRHEDRSSIVKNLAQSENYYENDSWSGKDIVIYQWDESKQKYALYSGERQLIYDGNCSICRKKCDEAWEYYQGVPEEDLAGFEDMVFGSGCERYACGKHGYYWTNVSYLEFDSDMQEMYLQEGDGKTGTLKAIQTFIRTEKADYKPKVNGSNKFPSNIKLTTFDGTLVSSSSFLNNNKPHIIHIHVYYQSLSSKLQKLFDAVCEDWGNKYNAELVTIDVSDRGGKEQYPYDCDTKFYYDELDDLKDNYLPHLFPNAKSHGFSTIIFVVNKNSEIVYSHWISNNDEIESIIEVITQKLQEIK